MTPPHERPDFRIPVGTQVVLKADKRMPGTDAVKPRGSVAEVLESPSGNGRPYLVRFVDGATLRVKFGELSVRKLEVGGELTTPGPDLRRYAVLLVGAGSRAFGLATDTSDEDRRGVYLPPAALHWSLFKPPEQFEATADGVEEVYWELEKYLLLALAANPNVLETLWSPVVLHADAVGRELRDLRDAFLSRHLYKTYSGYVLSQFRLMRRGFAKTGTFKAKHAMHLLRLMRGGIHALRTGAILVDVGEHRAGLLAVREGRHTFDEVQRMALDLNREFQEAFRATALPERPDYDRVNDFLVRARRSRVS